MNHSRFNTWLKPLVILLVIVLIVMLLIPAELTNEQLSQVQPGMTLQQVKELLGEPASGSWDLGVLVEESDGYRFTLSKKGQFWKPKVSAPVKGMSLSNEHTRWIGQTHLLWVQHDKDIVLKTWLLPITHSGGGLQGCVDSLLEYWHKWTK